MHLQGKATFLIRDFFFLKLILKLGRVKAFTGVGGVWGVCENGTVKAEKSPFWERSVPKKCLRIIGVSHHCASSLGAPCKASEAITVVSIDPFVTTWSSEREKVFSGRFRCQGRR
jgi:hypothetical protein